MNSFWFVFTGTVNLYSITNGIGFHHFWNQKLYGTLELILARIWWIFGLGILSCYFWNFSQYPEGVTDVWKHVQYLHLPHSLKFRNFNDVPFRMYVTCAVMWQRSVTLLNYSDHTQINASTQWDPTRFTILPCFTKFSLKTKFELPYLYCGYWSCLTLTAVTAFQWVLLRLTVVRQQCVPTEHDSQVIWRS